MQKFGTFFLGHPVYELLIGDIGNSSGISYEYRHVELPLFTTSKLQQLVSFTPY